jgi:predicted AlkP superfamily pyrophosphatase or phosphodiesterase
VDGYGVSGTVDGDDFVTTNVEARVALGTHGFLSHSPKMNAVCVLWGRGIQPGAKVEQAENIDVAPTIARLLGLAKFTADGRPLQAALVQP